MEDTYVRLINFRLHILFYIQLPPLTPNIIFCFSNHVEAFSLHSFHFRPLSFNDIMTEAISSQNMTDPNWLFYVGYYLEVFSSLLNVQEFVH